MDTPLVFDSTEEIPLGRLWTGDQPEIRYLGDLQRLRPQPGDVFVLSVDRPIDTQTADWLHSYVSKCIGCPADKVLVLDGSLKLEVMAAPPGPTTTIKVTTAGLSKEAAIAQGRAIQQGIAAHNIALVNRST